MHARAGSNWRALGSWAPRALGAALLPVAWSTGVWAADVVLENVRIGVGQIVYTAPRAEFRDTPLTQAELQRLLDGTSGETVAARVARLEAAEIVIPEITSEVTTPQGPQVTRYRETVISKVGGGRIGSVSSAGGTLEARGPEGVSRGTFGRFALQDLDLGLAVSLFTDKAPAIPALPLLPLYGSFSLEALSMTDPAGTATRVGRLFGRDLSARLTPEGWLGSLELIGANPDLKTASPDQRKRAFGAMADILGAFRIGTLEAADISFAGKDGGDQGRIDRIAFQGATASRPAEFAVEGFEAGTKDGRARFASLSFGGLSLAPMLDGLRELGASPTGEMSPATLRRLVPIIGNTRLAQLEVDVPSGEMPRLSNPSPTMRIGLGLIELLADKPVEGVPSDFRVAVRNLSFPVPSNPENDALKQLATLGYDRVDASLAASLGWNEAGQELLLRDVSLDGAGMGNVAMRAVLGNVARDVFNPDSAIASVALLGATAKSAEITIENRGLFERIVQREARRQKRNAEDIRREYGMAAAVGIPAILGSSDGAKTLAQAVSRFVAKPGKLTVKARAKQPRGYGVADFSAAPDPSAVLNALEVTATAE